MYYWQARLCEKQVRYYNITRIAKSSLGWICEAVLVPTTCDHSPWICQSPKMNTQSTLTPCDYVVVPHPADSTIHKKCSNYNVLGWSNHTFTWLYPFLAWWSYNVGPPFDSVQLVQITPISLWFMVPITIVFMGFINQRSHHSGAPHCSEWMSYLVGLVVLGPC